jgi:hypothetical protein
MLRSLHLSTLLSGLAIAAALAALVGDGAHPVAATTLIGSTGPLAAGGGASPTRAT